MNGIKLLAGYIPGAIGRIAGLHGTYYSRYLDFGLFFEVKVAFDGFVKNSFRPRRITKETGKRTPT